MANNAVRKVRDVLVIIAAILLIATVVFQWMEISKFELQSVIGNRLAAIFASEEVAEAPEAPADGAPAAPGMDMAPGMDKAPAPGPGMPPPMPGPAPQGM